MKNRLKIQMPAGVSKRDQAYIQTMQSILRANGIPDYEYSLHGYAESKVCLERVPRGWIVFNGERGQRYDVSTHKTVRVACVEIIRSLCDNKELENKLVSEFLIKARVIGRTADKTDGKDQVACIVVPGATIEKINPTIRVTKLGLKHKVVVHQGNSNSSTVERRSRQQTD